jgi:hypothetical protein
MVGFITERDLAQAEQSFPGIGHFFAALVDKPRTFLELVARFEHWGVQVVSACPAAAPAAALRSPRHGSRPAST